MNYKTVMALHKVANKLEKTAWDPRDTLGDAIGVGQDMFFKYVPRDLQVPLTIDLKNGLVNNVARPVHRFLYNQVPKVKATSKKVGNVVGKVAPVTGKYINDNIDKTVDDALTLDRSIKGLPTPDEFEEAFKQEGYPWTYEKDAKQTRINLDDIKEYRDQRRREKMRK